MSKELIRARRSQLEEVLAWATENDSDNTILPLGWRVCISQERCALYDQTNYLNGLLPKQDVRTYQVPPIIEERIQLILSKINK